MPVGTRGDSKETRRGFSQSLGITEGMLGRRKILLARRDYEEVKRRVEEEENVLKVLGLRKKQDYNFH